MIRKKSRAHIAVVYSKLNKFIVTNSVTESNADI